MDDSTSSIDEAVKIPSSLQDSLDYSIIESYLIISLLIIIQYSILS
jgi:hypothetical protein